MLHTSDLASSRDAVYSLNIVFSLYSRHDIATGSCTNFTSHIIELELANVDANPSGVSSDLESPSVKVKSFMTGYTSTDADALW